MAFKKTIEDFTCSHCGTAVVKDDTGAESSYAVDGGVIECAGNRVTVLL